MEDLDNHENFCFVATADIDIFSVFLTHDIFFCTNQDLMELMTRFMVRDLNIVTGGDD